MPHPKAEFREAAITHVLENCRLLAGLPREVIKEIAGFAVVKPVKKGGFIFHEGDRSDGFYIVQRGTICIHRINKAGKEQVIHLFRRNESFAEASVPTPSRYPVSARAVEPSQVILVKKDEFVAMLGQRPELAMRILASMSRHLKDLVGQIEGLTMKNVETRLAMWLLKRCPDPRSKSPFSFRLTIAKRVLAAEVGTVSETLSRTLARLRDENLVAVDGKLFTVVCPADLAGMLEQGFSD